MTTTPLIHIGYHKTATSWLQQRVFQPETGFAPVLSHQEVWDLIVRPHGLSFDPAPARALVSERIAGLADGLAPVISSEVLSGHPFFGGRGSEIYAARLEQIFPGTRILVTIRNQFRIIPSVYMQYLQRGGTLTAAAFLSGIDEPGFHGFDAAHFHYDRLIGCYDTLFGDANVHVLTQEAVARDGEAAVAALADFAGATRFQGLGPDAQSAYAPSYPESGAAILRRINHVRPSILNPVPVVSLGGGRKGIYAATGWLVRRSWARSLTGDGHPVRDVVAVRLAGQFRDSNRRLAQMRPDLDLSGYEGV
ncbi:MAG: hypothetical protein WBA67_01210 [Jannaschia sp.]